MIAKPTKISHWLLDGLSFDPATDGEPGVLAQSAFVVGTAATQPSAQIIYDNTTGRLSWDANGTTAGGVRTIMQLDGNPALTHTDIRIVS